MGTECEDSIVTRPRVNVAHPRVRLALNTLKTALLSAFEQTVGERKKMERVAGIEPATFSLEIRVCQNAAQEPAQGE
jgi:hypothetical protein